MTLGPESIDNDAGSPSRSVADNVMMLHELDDGDFTVSKIRRSRNGQVVDDNESLQEVHQEDGDLIVQVVDDGDGSEESGEETGTRNVFFLNCQSPPQADIDHFSEA